MLDADHSIIEYYLSKMVIRTCLTVMIVSGHARRGGHGRHDDRDHDHNYYGLASGGRDRYPNVHCRNKQRVGRSSTDPADKQPGGHMFRSRMD